MRIVPKYASGGSYSEFFTVYTPISLRVHPSSSSSSGKSSSGSSEKGELTEKDLFNMIKEIDGLPNEMNEIVSGLIRTLRLLNLEGAAAEDISTTYLTNLYLVKVAALNKEKYDKAIEVARANGALDEPAIDTDGRIFVQYRDGENEGEIAIVSPEEYVTNRDKYYILTTSNLANMRAYDTRFSGNLHIFNVIENSMGYEAFLKLLDDAKILLGYTKTSQSEQVGTLSEAVLGLALISSLTDEEKLEALAAILLGATGVSKLSKTNLGQINLLADYLTVSLPDRAKTWALLKTGIHEKSDTSPEIRNELLATKYLVLSYLLGKLETENSFTIKYPSDTRTTTDGDRSGNLEGNGEDPKTGIWVLVQRGQGGTSEYYTIMTENGESMSVLGKTYSLLPGFSDGNQSLSNYLNNSKVPASNRKKITIGDIPIASSSFKDVMVNVNAGAAVLSLPIKPDGTVNLEINLKYVEAQDELLAEGIGKDNANYYKKLKEKLENKGCPMILDEEGKPKEEYFGSFLVLEGITSSQAKGISNNAEVSIEDIQKNDNTKSDYIISKGTDSSLYDILEAGLSGKTKEEKYKLNRGRLFRYDILYKANIFIPLSTNSLDGQNADEFYVKHSTANLYEKAALQGTTDSSVL